ncbi:MAG: hypothetical protein ACPHL8_04095, partial [Flavobacteriales bacterium]
MKPLVEWLVSFSGGNQADTDDTDREMEREGALAKHHGRPSKEHMDSADKSAAPAPAPEPEIELAPPKPLPDTKDAEPAPEPEGVTTFTFFKGV